MILITGDFKLCSAQGVRYASLVAGHQDNSTDVLVTYSEGSDTLKDWERIIVRQSRFNSIFKIINAVQRRAFYPDAYLFRLRKYKAMLTGVISGNRAKNIIIGCTPFSLLLLAPWIKSLNPKLNLIADLSDPFSFNMVNQYRAARKSLSLKIEKKSLPCFDHIVVLNESIRDKYRELYPELAEKFKVVEQGVDLEFIKRIKNGCTPNTELYTFLYAGGFYRKGRNPMELYRAFEGVNKSCRLLIFGSIRKTLRPSKHHKIIYRKAIAKDSLAIETAKANALVMVDNDYGYQVPGKTIETLASGKPILFIYNNDQSPTLKYVREAKGVVWVKNNATDIQKGIETIIAGHYEKPDFDYQLYTWDVMRKKYQQILETK